ncbi:MAG: polysaccharide biosynthesis/export family protein [Geminicoccaceae bacterium]
MRLLAIVLGLGLLAGCSSDPGVPWCKDTGGKAPSEDLAGYQLGAGDKLRVTVFRNPELSGEFALDGEGYLAVPLGGEIAAKGLTTRQLEDQIEQRFKEGGFLVSPQVAIEVLTYRPFYILGEVSRPGEYPYVNGISVNNAVAMAGGYTYRADKDDIIIRRANCAIEAAQSTRILPGETITVNERFF